MSFTARFALVLAAGIVAAIVLAPLAAVAVAAAGWRFPFPRIFDRTVMATLLIAMLFSARDLNLASLLSRGFRHTAAPSIARAIRGFVVAMCALAILFALALAVGGGGVGDHVSGRSADPEILSLGDRDRIHRGSILPCIPARRHGRRLRQPNRADRERRNLRHRASRAIAGAFLRHRLSSRPRD